ncbi:hypothetical protein CEXT_124601, partial [Caerostris extrusa]
EKFNSQDKKCSTALSNAFQDVIVQRHKFANIAAVVRAAVSGQKRWRARGAHRMCEEELFMKASHSFLAAGMGKLRPAGQFRPTGRFYPGRG